jgi:hypothetical protein
MADFLFTQFANENIRTGTDLVQTTGYNTPGIGPGRYLSDGLATAALFAAHPRFVGRSSNGRFFRALPECGRLDLALAGVAANGTDDDSAAIRAAFAYATAIGADGVRFARRDHRLEAQPLPPSPIITGPQPSLWLDHKPGMLDFGGARLVSTAIGRNLVYFPGRVAPTIDLPLIADVAAGDRQVQVAAGDAAKLQPGDLVLWQLGELPYDIPETLVWDSARVTAVAGEVVSLDKPVPAGLVLSSVTGPNKRLRKLARLEDCTIRDLVLDARAGAESGIEITYAKRVTIERVGGKNLGAGVVVGRYCDGLTAVDCWQEGTPLFQPSYGPGFNFAECRDVLLLRPQVRGLRSLVRAEAGSEVQVQGGHFENTLVDSAGQPMGNFVMVIDAAGRGNVAVRDLTVTGFGGYNLAETSNGQPGYEGTVQFSGITRLRHPTMPFSIPVKAITGLLDLEIGGQREVHDFTRLRRWSRRFLLRDNEYLYAFGPPGILVRASFFTASGLTVGPGNQLTGLWLGREGDNGNNVATAPFGPLIPGSELTIPLFGGTVGGALWNLRNQRLQLLCVTAQNAGLDAACRFVEFEGWLTTRAEQDYPANEADWLAASSANDSFEADFPAASIPPLGAGGTIAFDLAVPTMQPTSFIEAVRVSGGLAGLALESVEARAGFARLNLANRTGGTIACPPTRIAVRFVQERLGR